MEDNKRILILKIYPSLISSHRIKSKTENLRQILVYKQVENNEDSETKTLKYGTQFVSCRQKLHMLALCPVQALKL